MPLIPNDWRVLTIDGVDGVGKTPLAEALGELLCCPVIGLDDFLIPDRGGFIGALRFAHIKDQILRLLCVRGRMIVEGCLVGEVMDRLAMISDVRIYVSRCSGRIYVSRCSGVVSGTAAPTFDEYDLLFGTEPPEVLIRKEERTAARFGRLCLELDGPEGKNWEYTLSALRQELIRYHRIRCPQQHADIHVAMVRHS